ncbi:MAG TPA: TrkH family potassium uptake protein [Hellea balneolensis]|uniref:Trk system potassium uptake protein n=1 Tax=Hellea balneolensis TaxID=287478 RepID=A0A7C5LU32_9PROT|nr:TrkH family potassium uptake protein [Hellea balneolensis]
MPDLRPVLFVISLMVTALGLIMFVPMLVDLFYRDTSWPGFALSGFFTTLFGAALALASYAPKFTLRPRGAFLLTVFSWCILSFFAAIPFMLQENGLSMTDAMFESMSGLTTTGSTVMIGLDDMPKGILLWRALLQWYGGVGIIVTALALLPRLNIGGMSLFKTEWFEPMGKILPKTGQIAAWIGIVYVGLSMICALIYWLLGIDPFDAICLSMTTLSTGGFANSDASFAAYANGGADIAASIFMAVAAMPFAAFVLALRGNPMALWRNPQARGFLTLLALVIASMVVYLYLQDHEGDAHPIRLVMFNVISMITGTGYGFGDFQTWGPLAPPVFLCLMFIGGCAGSTSCSVKIFRYQVAFEALRSYLFQMPRRHAVAPIKYGGRPLPAGAIYSVLGFFFAFMVCYAVAAIGLTLTGMDEISAFSSAATAITNVGPGLGDIVGPSGNFRTVPDMAKWIMTLAMIVGRLEIIPVLIVLSPGFWRS